MGKSQNVLISVVIPAYNYASSLERAVMSVVSQGGEGWELLVIDDGSTDHTIDVICDLKKQCVNYSHVQFISQKNKGLAAVRNRGVRETNGEYLIFLDADDEMCTGAISLLKEAIKSDSSVDLWVGGHVSRFENGREKVRCSKPVQGAAAQVRAYLFDKTLLLSNGSVAMRRSIFLKYKYPEQFRSVEDISMFVFVLSVFKVGFLNESLARVYKHSDSMRHDVRSALNSGLKLVDEVFSESRLPEKILSMKDEYYVQRALSLSRTCYEASLYQECWVFYSLALAKNKGVVFKWSYLRKALKSFYLKTKVGR